MTDTTETTTAVAAPKPALVAGGGAVKAIVPANVDQTWRLAGIIAAADMAPASYKKDPNKIMVAIMHGMEVGLTPLAALQSIAVINGMPTIWGDGALGLVYASGLVESFKEWVDKDSDGKPVIAHCHVKRRGQELIEQSFSMAEADEAGLRNKVGPWKQYPRRMLQMRARSWALRDGFADVLRGLGIAEEVRDMASLTDVTPPRRPQRGDYAEGAQAPETEPDAPATPTATPETVPVTTVPPLLGADGVTYAAETPERWMELYEDHLERADQPTEFSALNSDAYDVVDAMIAPAEDDAQPDMIGPGPGPAT